MKTKSLKKYISLFSFKECRTKDDRNEENAPFFLLSHLNSVLFHLFCLAFQQHFVVAATSYVSIPTRSKISLPLKLSQKHQKKNPFKLTQKKLEILSFRFLGFGMFHDFHLSWLPSTFTFFASSCFYFCFS